MKKTMSGCAAAVAALVVAGSAGAQVCAGFPTTDGQGTFGAFTNFHDDFEQYAVEGSYNLTGPFAINGGVMFSVVDDEFDPTDENDNLVYTFRGGAAFDLGSLLGGTLPGISICPNVRADYTSDSGATGWEVPVGVGFGALLPVSGGLTLTPYVIPALAWMRLSGDGLSGTRTEFHVRGGVDLNFDRYFLGGQVEWVNLEGADALFGVRAGIKF